MARKKKTVEFTGGGCLIQGLGLLFLFFFPIGTIIGIFLIIGGGIAANKIICDNCGIKIQKTARICPNCKEKFE